MRHVLVVDDDLDIRETVAEMLRDEGYHVTLASNGREALEQLAVIGSAPCLVLLDMMMPEMSGPELLKSLRDGHRLAALPVVAMSAHASAVDARGAKRFIRKPLSAEILLSVVREFCGC